MKIMRDPRPLSHTYVPHRLIAREKEYTVLLHASKLKRNAFLIGAAGTGKTALARRLAAALEAGGHPASYVDCRTKEGSYSAFLTAASSLGANVRFGLPAARFLEILAAQAHTLILDEFTALDAGSPRRLARRERLYRWLAFLIDHDVNVVLTTLDPLALNNLPPHLQSRIQVAPRIFLHTYNEEELYMILRDRAQLALRHDAYTEAALRSAARYAAETGNARYAIDILRSAVQAAEERGDDILTEEHVEEVASGGRAYEEYLAEELRGLGPHAKAYISALLELHGLGIEPTSGEAYEAYLAHAKSRGLRPLSMSGVSGVLIPSLAARGIIIVAGVKGKRGRTRMIIINPVIAALRRHM